AGLFSGQERGPADALLCCPPARYICVTPPGETRRYNSDTFELLRSQFKGRCDTMSGRKLSAPVFVALFAAVALPAPPAEKKAPTFDVKDLKLTVSGPHVHDNLTVFLLHSKDQDAREFLTLDKGLDQKLVTVKEKDQEQVGELVIENKSDKHLFLQEGDR